MKPTRLFTARALAALSTLGLASLALPSLAFAHHPLSGETPQTLFHGILSGLAHPVIGFDHLAFIIAVGIVTAFSTNRVRGPLGFLGGMFAGVLLAPAGLVMGFAEYIIMGSVVAIGALAVYGRSLNSYAFAAALAVVGLFHGYAYGGAVIGGETTPVVAYLAALTFVQGLIMFAAQAIVRRFAGLDGARAPVARISGGIVAGIGAAISLETLESLVFTAV